MNRASNAYGTLVDRVLFPLWEGALAGRPTLEYRQLLARTERAPLEELRALQTDKLRRLLTHAHAHVPHYADRFRAVGFEPGDFRSLGDLARLPILTREDARRTVGTRTSTAPPHVAFRARTGGTLGSMLEFGYDADTEWWRKAAQLRGWGFGGYRVGDRTFYYIGLNHGLHPPPGERLKSALERSLKQERYASCMVRDARSLEAAARAVVDHRPKVVVCFPHAGADLARHLSERREIFSDVLVLCHGEKLFPSDRLALEKAFGPKIFDMYASRETFMIASECEAHAGLHVMMENLVVEVLVREGEGWREAAHGETGEVVLTDLNNLGMPLIRYAIGDIATAPHFDPCACGRTLPRIDSVEGRAVETLRGPSGERISSMVFEQILLNTLGPAVKQFQILQRRGGAVSLRLACDRVFDAASVERLLSECRNMVKGLVVTAEVVPDLPPGPTGKRRVVVVERD